MLAPVFSRCSLNQSKSEATTPTIELGQEHIAMTTKKMKYNWQKLWRNSAHLRRKRHPVAECLNFPGIVVKNVRHLDNAYNSASVCTIFASFLLHSRP